MISTRFCSVCGAANELTRTSCFACGEALLASGGEHTQTQDGTLLHERYQPGTLLGAGGFSVVYRARDMQAGGRAVAIKQINLQGLSAEETIDATNTFNREVNLLSILHHPQIPQIYDHFNDRDHWYLILEYLEGMTLEVYLEKRAAQGKPIQIDEALAMVLQLCTVLEYLHTRQPPVIFRDLKPGNIIRTPGGKLCLIDFGIARTYRPGQSRDTQRLGSPGYAAPEQYGRTQTTPQADIYSLGALLHALLSGQDPALQERGLAPLHLAGYAGEAELAELVQQMLAPVPAERPAHVSEVAAMLQYVQERQRASHDIGRIWVPPVPQAHPVAFDGQQQTHVWQPTQPAPTTQPATRRRNGRRNLLIGFGALAATLVGGQVLWQTLKPRYYYPMPRTREFRPSPSGTIFTYRNHSDAVWCAKWSPDGQRIASASYDHTVQVWDGLSGNNPFIYRGHTGAVLNANWSPDGQRIASASADESVQIWDATDGSNILTYEGHHDSIQEANWSPDGSRIVSASLDKTAQIWDAQNGSLIGTYRGHKQEVLAAKWSPDGTRIASSSGDNTVQVWDAATMRTLFTYRKHAGAVNEVAWSPDGTRIASASDDATVRIWNPNDGSDSLTYASTRPINGTAWSGDGTLMASASNDNTVQVWDTSDGVLIFTYTGHTQPVQGAIWSPDGTLIASASSDSTVQVWQAP